MKFFPELQASDGKSCNHRSRISLVFNLQVSFVDFSVEEGVDKWQENRLRVIYIKTRVKKSGQKLFTLNVFCVW